MKLILPRKNGTMDEDVSSLFAGEQFEYECSLDLELQLLARRDLREDRPTREQAIREMREWVLTHPNIVRCRLDSNFLLRFLRVTKYCIPKTKSMLERYLLTRQAHPQWYQELDILDPELDDLIGKGFVFVLPERDDDGRRVIFGIGNGLDPDRHTQALTMRALAATFETLLEDETNHVRGFTYIFDQKNVSLRQATLWTPHAFRKALHCAERALPMRHKQCHFVHLPLIIRGLFEFFKTFLTPKLRQRLMVHSDVQSLSEHVPLQILPQEYGGQMPVQQMINLWKKEMLAKRSRSIALDYMYMDEQKKIKYIID